MRLQRKVAAPEVEASPPQVSNCRAQHFPGSKPLRREFGEQNRFDRIRAKAAAACRLHDEWAQAIDARGGGEDSTGARGEERAAETACGILGNRGTERCGLGRKSQSRGASHRSDHACGLGSNALRRMRPQCNEPNHDGKETEQWQHANCRARTRKADSNLGQRNPFLGDSGR
jgi:hypothetical protein